MVPSKINNGDRVTANYYGRTVSGHVRSQRIHDGYRETVYYMDLTQPTRSFCGEPVNSVMVRRSQVVSVCQ
jgi:hypothetical protein